MTENKHVMANHYAYDHHMSSTKFITMVELTQFLHMNRIKDPYYEGKYVEAAPGESRGHWEGPHLKYLENIGRRDLNTSFFLNTDAAAYAGSNQVNATPLATTEESAHGCAQSIELTVPPLATTFLRYKGT